MATLEQLSQLPVYSRAVVTPEYIDGYGHMNVRWYFELWGRAAQQMMRSLGLGEEYTRTRRGGDWVLKQIIDYLAEVREGETVTVRGRILGRTDKLMHNKYWMINETRGVVSATSEVLVAHADLDARRTAPFPPDVVQALDERIREFDQLDWEAPVAGVIRLQPRRTASPSA
jgi:acyl-CoA thioester hydrolase